MENYYLVILGWIIWCLSTQGLPQGGYKSPVKRSDFTMYDNQFFSVGDTELDNEVTDCAVVRHQYARGYIRLREYLERMQGCGSEGKRKNIAGIAASTRDAQALTSEGINIPSNSVAHVAPFKPKPIGRLLDNVDKKQDQVKAYNGQVKKLQSQLPFQQPAIQRSYQNQPSFNNLGLLSKTSALSFKNNIASHAAVPPVARKFISRKNLNTNPLQAFKTINNARSRQQYYISPDPQRYYSMQTTETKQAYRGSIEVGQPLLRPNPLAFSPQASVGSKPRTTQEDQPMNQGVNMGKSQLEKQPVNAEAGNRHDGIPEKQAWRGQDDLQDDITGGGDVRDEATEIASVKSDPIPSDAQFTENPRLEKEEHQSEDKMDDSSQEPQQNSNEKPTQHPSGGLVQAEKSNNADDLSAEKEGDVHDSAKETNDQNESNKLDEFLNPSTNEEKESEKDAQSNGNQVTNDFTRERQTPNTPDKNHPNGIAINLDVLKDKISSSRDIGFLKRMLTLIKKITHHKDFHKLAGVQKSAIMQAGNAVNSAVSKETNHNTERSFIQPRPVNANPYVGYYRGSASVNSYINAHPPKWNVGDRTLTGNAQAQFYRGKQTQITKKFQIERNPYYQPQRRVSYTPPYYSLQRLNYGLYNGNSP